MSTVNSTIKSEEMMNTASPKKKCEGACVCTKKFLKKWTNITRREHGNALARPKAVMLKPFPNPELIRDLPVKIERGTLYGKVPPRTEYLATPKRKLAKNKKPGNNQPPSGIIMRFSVSRMLDLARPQPKINAMRHKVCTQTEEKNNVYLNQNKLSSMTDSQRRLFRKDWLARNALPKARTRLVTKKKEKMLTRQQQDESSKRLSKLSDLRKERLSRRPYVRQAEPRPPGEKIVPFDLPWVNRLSQPRKLMQETILDLGYNPYLISKATLNAIPSKRILKLAEPKMLNITNEQLTKANPYEVSPLALKYKATKRILKLARPRIRA